MLMIINNRSKTSLISDSGFIVKFVIFTFNILAICNVYGENIDGLGSSDLGTAYEFKIHIDAGKEDCYYQYVDAGSSLYVAFQVCSWKL